ncbi:Aste57867_8439 [Aphanomyces stellatus]|uniref:Adenosine kinase n=1 Tax=Aphanomyces stellatus TaxID=120398 RepID=A0A485KK84_9STRA|nr:hypothetical protein As57867_008407 [Aphanomyces stellatus]VFT85325.1 Aste57867_8439 [Aphanomyces stellatus]
MAGGGDLRGRHLRILTFGNPMVDMILHVSNEFVASFGLTHGEAIHAHVAPEVRQKVVDTVVASPNVVRTTGGSALNSARTIQTFLPPQAAIFVGAVGDDSNADVVCQVARDQGVEMRIQSVTGCATSTCICLITPDNERTLLVQRQAHFHYTLDAAFVESVAAVDLVYVVSFVLSSPPRFECAHFAATHRAPHQLYCMNLSSANLLQVRVPRVHTTTRRHTPRRQNPDIVERLVALLPYCQLLLGNDQEVHALADALHLRDVDMPDLARAILDTYLAPNALIVVTAAAAPTWVVHATQSMAFPVEVPLDFKVQDTNGAGDAFVGGFFAGLMRFCNVADCVALGHLCALQCVQEEGCGVHLDPTDLARAHGFFREVSQASSLYELLRAGRPLSAS